MNFTEQLNIDSHESLYRKGYRHDYPNENMVRLVCSYFGQDGKGANVLDYGCGSGEICLCYSSNSSNVLA